MKNFLIDFVDMVLDAACAATGHAGTCFIYSKWVRYYVPNRWMK